MDTTDTLAELADVGRGMLTAGAPLLLLCALLLVAVHLVERRRTTPRQDAPLGNVLAALAGAVTGVVLWLVWFTLGLPGDLEVLMYVGAAASSFGALVWLSWRTRWRWTGPFSVALAGLTGFSTAMAVASGTDDVSGLWVVGYLVTTVLGMCFLAVVTLGVVVVREN